MTPTLHDMDFDEDSYKVRLLLGLLGIDYHRVRAAGSGSTDVVGLEPTAEGNGPCLVDGPTVVHEAEAILAYVARRYDWRDTWLPADDPALFGQTMTWLAFAARRLRAVGLVDAIFGMAPDDPEALQAAHAAFGRVESHLATRGLEGCAWCVGRTPTIADVAIFPALALSAQAGADLAPYPALRTWMQEMRGLAGFVAPPAADDARLSPPRRVPRAAMLHLRAGNVFVLTASKRRPANSAA